MHVQVEVECRVDRGILAAVCRVSSTRKQQEVAKRPGDPMSACQHLVGQHEEGGRKPYIL